MPQQDKEGSRSYMVLAFLEGLKEGVAAEIKF
jgi:hypothetical protein